MVEERRIHYYDQPCSGSLSGNQGGSGFIYPQADFCLSLYLKHIRGNFLILLVAAGSVGLLLAVVIGGLIVRKMIC